MVTDTLKKVDEILSRVNTHPEYSSILSQHLISNLSCDADNHSNSIELESGEMNGKEIIEIKGKSFENLRVARNFLEREGINLTSLSRLGSFLEPSKNNGSFRNELVKFGDFYGVDSSNIHSEIDNLIWRLNNVESHPVIRAADAHLDIVRIHPYLDGNGRAARLVQDVCLEQKAFPSIIIPINERELYLGLLNEYFSQLLNERSKEGSERAKNLFYHYIASKALNSAQNIEDELKMKRQYDVHLKGVDEKPYLIRVANAVRNKGRALGIPVKVNSNFRGKKSSGLVVQGNLGESDLRNYLKDISEKYGFKYDIKSKHDC